MGYRRITAELNDRYNNKNNKHYNEVHLHNITVNRKRVRRICLRFHIFSNIKYRNPGCTRKGKEQFIALNLLNRVFTADDINEKWCTDVTEFKWTDDTRTVKIYLSAIIDLCDKRIVAYEISSRNDNPLVINTFRKAMLLNPGAKPLVHSDRGFQYTSKEFFLMMRKAGMVQSMSRVGCCPDNGAIEGFWSILKRERYYKHTFSSPEELIWTIKDFIHYYNYERLLLKTGSTPMALHKKYMNAPRSHVSIPAC